MESVISFLKDAETVAKFQELCGIVFVKDEANGRPNGSHALQEHPNMPNPVVEEKDLHTNDRSNGFVVRNRVAEKVAKERNSQTTSGQSSTPNGIVHSPGSGDKCQMKDEYVIKNWFLYYIFHFGANLGNEVFYITFFPFWFWNIDGFVGRRLCIFWCTFMYLGQALKDIIKIPRPLSPPVARLEKRYALEYGMPSTHAMVGTGIPFAMFFMTAERYNYPSELALIGAIAWSSLVCCSRIYLGMHSILDVIIGVGIVSSLMFFCIPVLSAIDDFVLHSPYSPLICILVPLLMCFFYPTLDKWSTARGDTTIIMAVGAGIGLGHWVSYQYGYMLKAPTLPPYDIIPPTWSWAGLVILRMGIGIVILLTVRAAVKTLTFRAACYLAGYSHKDPEAHKTLIVELPYKFITYSVIAFNMVFTAPMVFRSIGIERETFFTEI